MATSPGSHPGNAMTLQMANNLRHTLWSCRAVKGTPTILIQCRTSAVTNRVVVQAATLPRQQFCSVDGAVGLGPLQGRKESARTDSPLQFWAASIRHVKPVFTTPCVTCHVGAGACLDRSSFPWTCILPTTNKIHWGSQLRTRLDANAKPSLYLGKPLLLPSACCSTSAQPGSLAPSKVSKLGKNKHRKKKHFIAQSVAGNVSKVSKQKSVSRKPTEQPASPPANLAGRTDHGVKEAVVIVESPAKAKTIGKYLGDKFTVVASYGHVRDLASRAGSVRPEEDFHMVWEVSSSAQQHLNSMKEALETANSLVLASDPDREGEAIAWHVLDMLTVDGALKSHHDVKRVVFHEITQSAVLRAMESPRDISDSLVSAYLARRALDYIIGFDLSPVLWRKLPGSKSAGRVQSAALRLIADRETEIEAFTPQEYWTVEALVSLLSASDTSSEGASGKTYIARLTHFMGEKLGQFSLTAETSVAAAKRVEESKLVVASVKTSVVRRNPPAPYITSTLQQDASNKLSFSATRTMMLAQQLYEGVKLGNDDLTGLITYMRTDGVQLSAEAIQNIRSVVATRYGEDLLPASPRSYQSKVKNAQEAHEAIRPTDASRVPSSLVNVLEEDALQLYTMIWCRAIACQMERATFNQVAAEIVNDDNSVELHCTGSTLVSPGYRVVYKDFLVKDGVSAPDDDEEGGSLPAFQPGDGIAVKQVWPSHHVTEPPPRYSEGSLVKKLEELGIGRPSTYASTVKTLQARTYVKIVKRRIIPEIRGQMVSMFLCKYFEQFVNYEFTAHLESQLDEISAGRLEWKAFLAHFWPQFHEAVSAAMKVPIEQVVQMLEERFVKQLVPGDRQCPKCLLGTISMKLSRYGAGYFLGCSRYPNCHYKANIFKGEDDENGDVQLQPIVEAPVLGKDPATGLEVLAKKGPFGRYVQLGHGPKPLRQSVPENFGELTLEAALEILTFPKNLGKHPDDNLPVSLNMGRKHLVVRHKGVSAVVPEVLAAENVTLDVAVELLRLCGGGKPGRPSPKRIPEPVTSNKEKDRQLKKLVQAAIAENGRKKQADLAEEHLSSDALDHQGHETSPLPENSSTNKVPRKGRPKKSTNTVSKRQNTMSKTSPELKANQNGGPTSGTEVISEEHGANASRASQPVKLDDRVVTATEAEQVQVMQPRRKRGRPRLVREAAA